MPRILVTGGAGYVGAHTVHHLVRHGTPARDVVVLDDLSTGHGSHLPPGVEHVRGDLTVAADVAAAFSRGGIERVLHFAGVTYVGESMADPGKYFRTNVYGGLNLLHAMRVAGCRQIVFSSSCATYGLPTRLPISEEHPQAPVSPYGESKLMLERMLGWYGMAHGFRSIALRYFNAAGAAYGIGERHEPETHLIPLAIRAALDAAAPLSVFGTDYDTPDGTCIRDYIHVVDLAEAHARALSLVGATSEPFTALNLGTGKGTSVQEILRLIGDLAGRQVPVVHAPRRQGDPAVLVADAARAAAVLGWRASRGIAEIVRDAWAWHVGHTREKTRVPPYRT